LGNENREEGIIEIAARRNREQNERGGHHSLIEIIQQQ